MKEKKLESLIDIAIDREAEAYDFYRGLSDKVEDPDAKDTLGLSSRTRSKSTVSFW